VSSLRPRLIGVLAIALAIATVVAQAGSFYGVDRVVAVGDVHGDYDQLVDLLQSAGIIDDDHDWAGGRAHFVQTGDVLDRGPESRRAMDLLMKLEEQASAVGGRVHALIGNHEAMNLTGDRRYVSAGEYDAFAGDRSETVRERAWKHFLEHDRRNIAGLSLKEVRRRWEIAHPLGFWEHGRQMSDKGRYGKWIRGHDTVVLIDDTLFLHGGLSASYASKSIFEINEAVRSALNDADDVDSDSIVRDPEGPLWYRGLARADAAELEDHVAHVLKRYGVKRIVIGHTTTDGAVMPRFGGRVVMIDVGLGEAYGSRSACLVIEKGAVTALHRGARFELPDDDDGLLDYLTRAAALDPEPSPLSARIEALEATSMAAVPVAP